ncbi:MAG: hypothetical protein ACPG4K_12580 [Haloferula sp.]
MKAVLLIALSGLTVCLSSCSTAGRSMDSLTRTAARASAMYNNRQDIAAETGARSLVTAQRTGAVAQRSYGTAQRTYQNAGATASRTQGTIGRFFDSIGRSFR